MLPALSLIFHFLSFFSLSEVMSSASCSIGSAPDSAGSSFTDDAAAAAESSWADTPDNETWEDNVVAVSRSGSLAVASVTQRGENNEIVVGILKQIIEIKLIQKHI